MPGIESLNFNLQILWMAVGGLATVEAVALRKRVFVPSGFSLAHDPNIDTSCAVAV